MRNFCKTVSIVLAVVILVSSLSFSAFADVQRSYTVFKGEKKLEGWYPAFITEYMESAKMSRFISAAKNSGATIEVTYSGNSSISLLLQSYTKKVGGSYTWATYSKSTVKLSGDKKIAVFSASGLLKAYTSKKHEDDGSYLSLNNVLNFSIDGSGNTVYSVVVKWTSKGDSKDVYAFDEDVPSLYEAFSDYFRIGSAINSWDLNENSDEFYIINKQFNIYTFENETKPDQIHPQENTYNFTQTDKLVEFAEKYEKSVRGHTLVWHTQCPDWFFKTKNGGRATAKLLVQRLEKHVTDIVTHYKGKIDTWDVVNEVLSDGYGLRDSDWLKIVGDYDKDGDNYDFIEIAFRAARKADPDARLIINDYSLESSYNKAKTMYDMVKKMLQEGVPIDGIGLQMHISYDFDVNQCRKNMELLASLREINPDFVLEITELDMSCFTWGDQSKEKTLTSQFVKQFDNKYCELFKMLIDFAREGIVDTVVFWGYNDGGSWLNGFPVEGRTNHPLLIDREYKFKSAYWELLKVAESAKKEDEKAKSQAASSEKSS